MRLMSEVVLQVESLVKNYGKFEAVKGISFQLKEGEILGLLGPNGAGKTTTIQMLLGLTIPTSGEIKYFGKDFDRNREYCLQRINFASANSKVQDKLTVWQNLRIFAGLYGVANWRSRVDELIEVLNMETYQNELCWKLSSGQRTRVVLAKALLNKPKVMLMDEPTASLDPEIVDRVLDMIVELQKKEKVAMLFTSHNMAEVARICDRVMFLDEGKIVAVDTPLGLTKLAGNARLILTFDGKAEPVTNYLKDKKLAFSFVRPQVAEVVLQEDLIPKTLFGLSERGVWLTDIDVRKPDLEDVFLAIARRKR